MKNANSPSPQTKRQRTTRCLFPPALRFLLFLRLRPERDALVFVIVIRLVLVVITLVALVAITDIPLLVIVVEHDLAHALARGRRAGDGVVGAHQRRDDRADGELLRQVSLVGRGGERRGAAHDGRDARVGGALRQAAGELVLRRRRQHLQRRPVVRHRGRCSLAMRVFFELFGEEDLLVG